MHTMHLSGCLIVVFGAVLLCLSACEANPTCNCTEQELYNSECSLGRMLTFGYEYMVRKLLMYNVQCN